MGLKQIIKQSILRSDLLSAQASLRYKGEPQYESVCGGIMSIIIVLVFSAIFINTFISVIQLQQISSTQQLASNLDSSKSLQNFMFAVGINGISPTDFQSYFSIQLIQNTNELMTNSSGGNSKDWKDQTIDLVPCSVSQWTSFGISDMQTFYTRRNISHMFCPSSNSNYSIQGTQDEDIFKYLTLIVTGCRQSANDTACVNQTQKEQFISNWITNNDFFQVKFYLMNTIITATNEDPISYYVETDVFLAFTSNTGTVGNIKLADYQIDTDTSFLPWTQYDTITGYFVDSFDTSTINQSKQKYVKLDISKSTKMLTVTRQYGKIDDALSYVGGLFSLLFVLVQFFMMSYNEYRYQLSVGESLFNYDQKGSQFKEQDFGFINYLIYSIYDWCAFFKFQPNWQLYKKYHQTRQEANQQLDVRYLMKKIRYLQSVVQILISQDQQVCLSLSELPTIQKVQRKRKLSQFSKNIRSNENIMSNIIRKRKNSMQSRRTLMSENSKRVIPANEEMLPNPSSKMGDQITQHEFNFNENSSQKSNNSDDIGFLISEAFLRIQRQKQDPLNRRIYKQIPQDIINHVKLQKKQLRSRNRIKSGQITQLADIYPQRMIVGERISKMKSKSKKNIE